MLALARNYFHHVDPVTWNNNGKSVKDSIRTNCAVKQIEILIYFDR